MNPLLKAELLAESALWRDDEGYRKVSVYSPFLIGKAKMEMWKEDYSEDIDFFRYVRVTMSTGHTFLVSKDTHMIVLSKAYNNYVGASSFLHEFGTVVKQSSVLYSLLSPAKLCQFYPNGINICDAVRHTQNSGLPLTELFCDVADDWGIPDHEINDLVSQITTVKQSVKLNKSLEDFQGLITKKDYDHTIVPYAKSSNKMFFVTKGPRRGMFLSVGGNMGKWLTGVPVFTASKPTNMDVVYGDYEEPGEMSDLSVHIKKTSQCLVAEHQGFFVGVKES